MRVSNASVLKRWVISYLGVVAMLGATGEEGVPNPKIFCEFANVVF